MKRGDLPLEPELEAFLEHRKVERHVPPEIRDRALASARAIIAAEGAAPASPSLLVPAPPPMPAVRGRVLFRIAVAASIAIAGAAVGAAAALHSRSGLGQPAALPDKPASAPSVPTTSVDGSSRKSPTVPAERAVPASAPHPGRGTTKVDPFTAELDLLQRAHAAYTQRDFSAALTLIAEHARGFPKGHLAEQREALRVRSLAGAGRADEAHRAAAAFARRFPRSVLVPRLEEGLESSEP